VVPARVTALAFAATWKAVIPLDSARRPLADAMIWMDSRATEQAARLNDSAGFFVGTGQEYWPRVMWLKQERPDIWARTEHVVGLNTYFKLRATGRLVTDPSDDFVRSPVPEPDAHYTRILKAAGLAEDVAKFPSSEVSTAQVGSLTAEAADHLGLPVGTRVYNGFTDLPAVTIGSGSGAIGDLHIYLGSSSWFARVSRADHTPDASASFAMDADRRGNIYGLQSACIAYDWAVAQLYAAEKRELGPGINAMVNVDVEATPPGAGGLLATHWLTGEIPPLASKNAKGLFLNLTPLHDRRHMVRAVMESIAFSHRTGFERHREAGAGDLARVRVVGGGAASDVWMQIFADVLGVPVEVPAAPNLAGAMGAVYSTMVGLGVIDDYQASRRVVPVERRFEPRSEHAATYDRLYSVYTKLHPTLSELFAELNGDY
jgi:xylulokinase